MAIAELLLTTRSQCSQPSLLFHFAVSGSLRFLETSVLLFVASTYSSSMWVNKQPYTNYRGSWEIPATIAVKVCVRPMFSHVYRIGSPI